MGRPPKELLQFPGNQVCADCGAHAPRWASVNLGILICETCSGIHRHLGAHLSQVRSISLDDWKPEWIATLRRVGNARAKAFYEHNVPESEALKCGPNGVELEGGDRLDRSAAAELERWIRAKYEARSFAPADVPAPHEATSEEEAEVSVPSDQDHLQTQEDFGGFLVDDHRPHHSHHHRHRQHRQHRQHHKPRAQSLLVASVVAGKAKAPWDLGGFSNSNGTGLGNPEPDCRFQPTPFEVEVGVTDPFQVPDIPKSSGSETGMELPLPMPMPMPASFLQPADAHFEQQPDDSLPVEPKQNQTHWAAVADWTDDTDKTESPGNPMAGADFTLAPWPKFSPGRPSRAEDVDVEDEDDELGDESGGGSSVEETRLIQEAPSVDAGSACCLPLGSTTQWAWPVGTGGYHRLDGKKRIVVHTNQGSRGLIRQD